MHIQFVDLQKKTGWVSIAIFKITRGQNKDGKLENPKGISMGTSSIIKLY